MRLLRIAFLICAPSGLLFAQNMQDLALSKGSGSPKVSSRSLASPGVKHSRSANSGISTYSHSTAGSSGSVAGEKSSSASELNKIEQSTVKSLHTADHKKSTSPSSSASLADAGNPVHNKNRRMKFQYHPTRSGKNLATRQPAHTGSRKMPY